MAGRRISDEQLVEIIEAAIFVADKPISKRHIKDTVLVDIAISMSRINDAIETIQTHFQTRGLVRNLAISSLSCVFLSDASKYSMAATFLPVYCFA